MGLCKRTWVYMCKLEEMLIESAAKCVCMCSKSFAIAKELQCHRRLSRVTVGILGLKRDQTRVVKVDTNAPTVLMEFQENVKSLVQFYIFSRVIHMARRRYLTNEMKTPQQTLV